nr:hypothetical protein [Mycoplasmopsis bovis]
MHNFLNKSIKKENRSWTIQQFFPNLKVKVFGIGGAGNNAINNIIADDQFDSSAIEFWAINTDSQHLQDNRKQMRK